MDIDKSKSEPRPRSRIINDSTFSHESWKIFQVMAEFVEGYERLFQIKPSVSVFGSARSKPGSPLYQLSEDIGKKLSDGGFSVVTGGGPGCMEAVNKGAYRGSSLSVGLNIELPNQEVSNIYQDISLRFRHFFTRKVMFVKYAAAFIALPGGYGTLDELTEILALIQTKKARQIPIILVQASFWQGLVDWFKDMLVTHKMINEKDLELMQIVETPEQVLETIQAFYRKEGTKTEYQSTLKEPDL